jgi:hypothetical protein
VFGGVVGDAVLPAPPDDVEPSAGQDADRVGVVEVSCSGALVEVGGPGVGVVGVPGEVDHGTAELLVDCPSEGDHFDVAGLFGRGCGASQTDQGLGGGEPSAGVADLGQQPSGTDGAGLGERGEDRGVEMVGEMMVRDLVFEGLDLSAQAGQRGDQGQGDLGPGCGGRWCPAVPGPGGPTACRD